MANFSLLFNGYIFISSEYFKYTVLNMQQRHVYKKKTTQKN